MLLAERQQLHLAVPMVRPSIGAMIQTLRAQLDDFDSQMIAHVRQHFAEVDALLQSTRGIGPSPAPY